MEMFKLMEYDSGYFVAHTTGLTEEEARKRLKTHSDLYPNQEWYIEPYDDSEEGGRKKKSEQLLGMPAMVGKTSINTNIKLKTKWKRNYL